MLLFSFCFLKQFYSNSLYVFFPHDFHLSDLTASLSSSFSLLSCLKNGTSEPLFSVATGAMGQTGHSTFLVNIEWLVFHCHVGVNF